MCAIQNLENEGADAKEASIRKETPPKDPSKLHYPTTSMKTSYQLPSMSFHGLAGSYGIGRHQLTLNM